MGDEELRALERRWRETGAVEDEARWHLARVRAGALPQARLELAAALGVPGARVALGRRAGVKPVRGVTPSTDDRASLAAITRLRES